MFFLYSSNAFFTTHIASSLNLTSEIPHMSGIMHKIELAFRACCTFSRSACSHMAFCMSSFFIALFVIVSKFYLIKSKSYANTYGLLSHVPLPDNASIRRAQVDILTAIHDDLFRSLPYVSECARDGCVSVNAHRNPPIYCRECCR